MDKFYKIIGAGIAFIALILITLPLSTLFGGLAGMIVGWLFGQEILDVVGKLGLHGVTMWQLGLTGGFFGGFLRTTVTQRKD